MVCRSVLGVIAVLTPLLGLFQERTTKAGPQGVHFHSQLEHVKLFLAKQKPLLEIYHTVVPFRGNPCACRQICRHHRAADAPLAAQF